MLAQVRDHVHASIPPLLHHPDHVFSLVTQSVVLTDVLVPDIIIPSPHAVDLEINVSDVVFDGCDALSHLVGGRMCLHLLDFFL